MRKLNLKILIAVIIAVIILIVALVAWFNSENWSRYVKDLSSEYTGGLNRTLTVYDYSGQPIKSYSGKFDIEDGGESGDGSCKVKFDLEGKRHIIYGGIVIVDEE